MSDFERKSKERMSERANEQKSKFPTRLQGRLHPGPVASGRGLPQPHPQCGFRPPALPHHPHVCPLPRAEEPAGLQPHVSGHQHIYVPGAFIFVSRRRTFRKG